MKPRVDDQHTQGLVSTSSILERIGELRDELRGPLTPGDVQLTLAMIVEQQNALREAVSVVESVLDVEPPTTLEELDQFIQELSQWV